MSFLIMHCYVGYYPDIPPTQHNTTVSIVGVAGLFLHLTFHCYQVFVRCAHIRYFRNIPRHIVLPVNLYRTLIIFIFRCAA